MNSEGTTPRAATDEISLSGTDYVSTRDRAYEDCVKAYNDLDKWLLALTGGGTAFITVQLKDASEIGLLHVAGVFFSLSVMMLLWSKWCSYRNSLETMNLVEEIWNISEDDFALKYHDAADQKIERENKTAATKDFIAFFAFIIGMLLIIFSFISVSKAECGQQGSEYTNGCSAHGTASEIPGSSSSEERKTRSKGITSEASGEPEAKTAQE
mgnify:CR=1 FL=1